LASVEGDSVYKTTFKTFKQGWQYVTVRLEFEYYVLRNKIVLYQCNVPQFNFWSIP